MFLLNYILSFLIGSLSIGISGKLMGEKNKWFSFTNWLALFFPFLHFLLLVTKVLSYPYELILVEVNWFLPFFKGAGGLFIYLIVICVFQLVMVLFLLFQGYLFFKSGQSLTSSLMVRMLLSITLYFFIAFLISSLHISI